MNTITRHNNRPFTTNTNTQSSTLRTTYLRHRPIRFITIRHSTLGHQKRNTIIFMTRRQVLNRRPPNLRFNTQRPRPRVTSTRTTPNQRNITVTISRRTIPTINRHTITTLRNRNTRRQNVSTGSSRTLNMAKTMVRRTNLRPHITFTYQLNSTILFSRRVHTTLHILVKVVIARIRTRVTTISGAQHLVLEYRQFDNPTKLGSNRRRKRHTGRVYIRRGAPMGGSHTTRTLNIQTIVVRGKSTEESRP